MDASDVMMWHESARTNTVQYKSTNNRHLGTGLAAMRSQFTCVHTNTIHGWWSLRRDPLSLWFDDHHSLSFSHCSVQDLSWCVWCHSPTCRHQQRRLRIRLSTLTFTLIVSIIIIISLPSLVQSLSYSILNNSFSLCCWILSKSSLSLLLVFE